MTIITNCPHCKTTFNVPDAIIAKYKSLVRCAKCSGIFNAIEYQVKDKIKQPATGQTKTNTENILNKSIPNDNIEVKKDILASNKSKQEKGITENISSPAFIQNSNENKINDINPDIQLKKDIQETPDITTNVLEDSQQPILGMPSSQSWLSKIKEKFKQKFTKPQFQVKDLQENTKLNKRLNTWGNQQKHRPLFMFGSILLGVIVFLQICYWQRNNIANLFPSTASALSLLANSVGSRLAPLKLKDNPVVSFSDMQKDLSFNANRYVLNIGLQNRYSGEVAMPSLEVSLFDLNEQIVTRRVFHPQTFTKTSDWKRLETYGLRANEEFPVKLRFETNQAISSFKVVVFYP